MIYWVIGTAFSSVCFGYAIACLVCSPAASSPLVNDQEKLDELVTKFRTMRLDDPTHQNDMPLTWYQNEFAAAGFRRD